MKLELSMALIAHARKQFLMHYVARNLKSLLLRILEWLLIIQTTFFKLVKARPSRLRKLILMNI